MFTCQNTEKFSLILKSCCSSNLPVVSLCIVLWDHPSKTSANVSRFFTTTPLPSAVFYYYPSANLANFCPSSPKKCRRLKWMVPSILLSFFFHHVITACSLNFVFFFTKTILYILWSQSEFSKVDMYLTFLLAAATC